MIALLSLTNSSSNQSDITQLPFRPPSKWSHFSREHSSMSTESFHNSPCQCCNCRDEGRAVLLKICSLLHILTAWKSQPQRGSERGVKKCHCPKIQTYTCPWWKSHPQQFPKQCKEKIQVPVIISSTGVGQNLNLTHPSPSSQHMGGSSRGVGSHLSKL